MSRTCELVNRLNNTMATPRLPIEILLVEDRDDEIERIEQAISETELSNRVLVARTGTEAIRYLKHEPAINGNPVPDGPPGLILLDVNMREKRGFDVLHELRTDPQLMTIPIVILTDSLDSTDLACSLAHGVTGYFLKPMEATQLEQVVKDLEEHWSLLLIDPSVN
jgi:CheY-like chemotaxis protein